MQYPYFIYRLVSLPSRQITRALPRRFWDRVAIVEGGEPMVEIQGFRLRKTVVEKLKQVMVSLPAGISLKILDGYRSSAQQKQAWERKWIVVKNEHPEWSADQIDREVRQVVARPEGISNHVCGGAVDVCLVDERGMMLDFGTDYAAGGEAGRRMCPMFAPGLSPEQIRNRKILRRAMESAGFVWYPGEWWHYCYGDRMWAVYSGRTECCYGPVEM